MGRRNRQAQGQQQQVKGFRPGKQPKPLTKQQLKKQMPNMSAAQERMVDLFADKSPEESKKVLARWRMIALAVGVFFSILAVIIGSWNLFAGGAVGLAAAVAFFAWLRMRAQRGQLEEMADQIARATGKR